MQTKIGKKTDGRKGKENAGFLKTTVSLRGSEQVSRKRGMQCAHGFTGLLPTWGYSSWNHPGPVRNHHTLVLWMVLLAFSIKSM